MAMNKSLFLVLCIICGLSIACNSHSAFDETISIPNKIWNKKNVANFTITIPDTTQKYDVMISITNNDSYQYSNLYLFTNINFPDKKYSHDTIEFFVADQTGEWTGKGMKNHTNTYAFRSNIRFPKPGKYTFSFEQAMRCTDDDCNLEGIEKIGLSLIRK